MLHRTGLVFLSVLLAGTAAAQDRNCSLQPPDAAVQPRHYAVDLSDNPSLLAGPGTPGCPRPSPSCIAPGYELMAVSVMGIFTRGDYACVLYIRPDDPWGLPWRSGFLPLSILTAIPAGDVDWSGTWTARYPQASITLTPAANGGIHIEALAANMEKTANSVAKNLYREDVIAEDVVPRKATLAFEQTGEDIAAPYQGDMTTCPVRLWRGGDYLLVADNPYCGAPDVSFTGFYTRDEAR